MVKLYDYYYTLTTLDSFYFISLSFVRSVLEIETNFLTLDFSDVLFQGLRSLCFFFVFFMDLSVVSLHCILFSFFAKRKKCGV